MPKKSKTVEDRLETIEFLLAGILLDRKLSIRQIAKIMGISDSKLSEMLPQSKEKGSD